jgi:hypothetical protein
MYCNHGSYGLVEPPILHSTIVVEIQQGTRQSWVTTELDKMATGPSTMAAATPPAGAKATATVQSQCAALHRRPHDVNKSGGVKISKLSCKTAVTVHHPRGCACTYTST